jgi:hypothetical protein
MSSHIATLLTQRYSSVYYNGDTGRIPAPLRKTVVGAIEGLFGRALVRATAAAAVLPYASGPSASADGLTSANGDTDADDIASLRRLSSNLWISCGEAGVRVQTHYDTVETVLVQLEGTKEVLTQLHDCVLVFDFTSTSTFSLSFLQSVGHVCDQIGLTRNRRLQLNRRSAKKFNKQEEEEEGGGGGGLLPPLSIIALSPSRFSFIFRSSRPTF